MWTAIAFFIPGFTETCLVAGKDSKRLFPFSRRRNTTINQIQRTFIPLHGLLAFDMQCYPSASWHSRSPAKEVNSFVQRFSTQDGWHAYAITIPGIVRLSMLVPIPKAPFNSSIYHSPKTITFPIQWSEIKDFLRVYIYILHLYYPLIYLSYRPEPLSRSGLEIWVCSAKMR